jgi:hypothetical protein
MHLVGARQGDLLQFFHIHPKVQGTKFVIDHLFTEPGTYSMWPGITYGGMHVNPKMPDLVIGTPAPITNYSPSFDRIAKLDDNLVITMKAGSKLYAGTNHNFGFAVTDSGGFDVPLGRYLLENMHINIISPDATFYNHLHTNYGMIGMDSEAGSSEKLAGPVSIKGVTIVPTASADAGHVHTTAVTGAPTDQEVINFNDKDMRVLVNFPTAGKYKIFTEFVTQADPNQVHLASFWVDVGQPQPTSARFPKWILAIVSVLVIAAVMPFIFKFLNEDRIKV